MENNKLLCYVFCDWYLNSNWMLESCRLSVSGWAVPVVSQLVRWDRLYTVTSLSLSSLFSFRGSSAGSSAAAALAGLAGPATRLSIPIRSGLISMSMSTVTADCGGRARVLRQSPRPAPPRPDTVRGFSYCHQLYCTVYMCTVVYSDVKCRDPELRRRYTQPSPPQLPNTDHTLAHFEKQMKRRKEYYFLWDEMYWNY